MELSLVFIGGLLGSSHCVGMCGGFAVSIGTGASRIRQNFARQLVYSMGRILTYAFLGALAGFAGASLKTHAGTFINVSAALSMIAGGLLLWQGVSLLGIFSPKKPQAAQHAPCLTGGLLSTFLQSPHLFDMFIAGVITGFLPCGLVYAFLTYASVSGNFLTGAMMMAAFGLGTVPLMVVSGLSISALSVPLREKFYRAAAVIVILTGVLTIGRGVAFASGVASSSPITCPFCDSEVIHE